MAIMLFRHFWNLDVLLTLCLYGVLTIGDWFQGRNIIDLTLKALVDNATHHVIGLITWFIVILGSERIDISHCFEVLLCGIFSSVIDVDHFIAAGSLNLKDATNLSSRPFLHCTSIPVLVCTLLIALTSMCKLTMLHRYSWILLAAFLSHHIRDALSSWLLGVAFWFHCTSFLPAVYYINYWSSFYNKIWVESFTT